MGAPYPLAFGADDLDPKIRMRFRVPDFRRLLALVGSGRPRCKALGLSGKQGAAAQR